MPIKKSNLYTHKIKKMANKDAAGNVFIESKLIDVNQHLRISLIEKGWTNRACIRINIKDENNHLRPGPEIPIENIEALVSAIITLIKEK